MNSEGISHDLNSYRSGLAIRFYGDAWSTRTLVLVSNCLTLNTVALVHKKIQMRHNYRRGNKAQQL